MPTAITPVAQWVPALTNAGADIPNSANMLAVLQSHADRQEYLYQEGYAQSLCMPVSATLASVSCGCVVLDARFHQILAFQARDTSGNHLCMPLTLSGDPLASLVALPSTTGTIVGAASDDNGVVVAVVRTDTATATKIVRRSLGAAFSTANVNDARQGTYAGVCWNAHGPAFVMFNAYGGTTQLESALTGLSWTVLGTVPANARAIAANGLGTLVAVCHGTATAYRSANDGASFSPVTLPASSTWRTVAARFGTNEWAASDGSVLARSYDDGVTWITGTVTRVPSGGSTAFGRLAFLGQRLIGQDTSTGDVWVSFGGAYFAPIAALGVAVSGDRYGLCASRGGIVAVAATASDTKVRTSIMRGPL